jgi:outer membrane protein
MHLRKHRGLALAFIAVSVVVSVGFATGPSVAQGPAPTPRPAATATTSATATPAPRPSVTPLVIPSPLSSLPPASQASTLPYPAYGSPAPGVDRGTRTSEAPPVVTLDQAIAIAFAKSPLLAQARASIEIATAPVNLARTAILPNVSGTVSTTRTDRQVGSSSSASSSSSTTTTGTAATAANVTSNALNVQIRQLIFDGGRVAAQLRAARANLSSSLALYKRQLQIVAFNVANSYYAALAAQRQTAVAVESVNLNQVNENLVNAQLNAGTASRVDLATAQLPTAQARVAVVRAQGAELFAQAAFVNAMGLDANAYVLPQDDGNVLSATSFNPAVPIPTYDQAIQRALLLRPDYAAQIASVESVKASLRAAKLGTFPTLSGTASGGTASSDPAGGTFRNAGSIGVTLSIPIYDQGITAAQTAQVQGQLDQALAVLDTARLGIQLNVKQTLVNLISSRSVFDQTSAELSKAQEVLRATQAQYQAGVTTLPLLLNAQVGLTQALTDQVTALYALRQAEAAFLFAEGANAPA